MRRTVLRLTRTARVMARCPSPCCASVTTCKTNSSRLVQDCMRRPRGDVFDGMAQCTEHRAQARERVENQHSRALTEC